MPIGGDFLVIGSGIAGLRAAISLAEAGRVVILTKANPQESNTGYAQGGIAAAVGADDSPELHASDTMAAGDGLCAPEAVRALVDRFYDLMDTLPEAAGIRALHPETLDESRNKLFWFLSGWMGGPQLYVERFGHPRLRARHLPFPIGESERDQWLLCMDKALAQTGASAELVEMLKIPMYRVANAVKNREGPSIAVGNPNIIAAG